VQLVTENTRTLPSLSHGFMFKNWICQCRVWRNISWEYFYQWEILLAEMKCNFCGWLLLVA
jgi:hypothetical protein